MFNRIVHELQGSDWVEIQCACPERVLNLMGVKQIPFWDLQVVSEICLRLCLPRNQQAELQEVAAQTGAQMEILRRRGIPMLWGQFKRRYVLLAGIALFWLLLFSGNLFIWEFRVNGNESVPTEKVLRALENYGITVGSSGLSIDQEDMRNHVLLELHDVSWLTVNVKGCIAYVQVVERQRPPEVAQKKGVCNIVSTRDGLVTDVQALNGRSQVSPGSTVMAGELLISGVYEPREGSTYLTHSLGKVTARTWYESSVSVPLQVEGKTSEKRKHTSIAVIFGKKRIKLWGRGSITGENCAKITCYHPVILLGELRLPITLVTETVTEYHVTDTHRNREQAQKEGENLLLQQLQRQIENVGTVTQTRFSSARQGKYLLVSMKAECLESIGREVQVETEGNSAE